MIDVTGKMVEAAWKAYVGGVRRALMPDERTRLALALEAALAAREPVNAGELVKKLRYPTKSRLSSLKGEARSLIRHQSDDFGLMTMNLSEACLEAADAIAELVDALRRIHSIENKQFGPDWEEIDEARAIATAALARMGVSITTRAGPPEKVGGGKRNGRGHRRAADV